MLFLFVCLFVFFSVFPITLDKREYPDKDLCYFSVETYVVGIY